MYQKKSEVIQSYKTQIKQYVEKMKKAGNVPVDEISEYFGGAGRWSTAYYELQFTLPFDKAKFVPMIEKWCADNGYKITRASQHIWNEAQTLSNQPAAGLFFYCERVENSTVGRFEMCLRTGEDGDNCQIKPIGKKEVNIYEVTCGDA